MDYCVLVTYFLPKIIKIKLAYYSLIKPSLPITLSFSVTNQCQSRCLTCKIWQIYQNDPELKQKELTVEEIHKIFKNINSFIYFFNISGGEPYLRKDLPEIVKYAAQYLKPRIIHIPTNCLAPNVVEHSTNAIIRVLKDLKWKGVLTIKPSIDAIGAKHDKIRGVGGNFNKVLETFERLKRLKAIYPQLSVEAGTVISKFNLNDIDEVSSFVESLGIDNYRNELAGQRAEFLNFGDDITPSAEEYKKAIEDFESSVAGNIKGKSTYTKMTQAFRFSYYDLVVKILKQNKPAIPCMAGLANIHLTPYGDLWPCCVLGKEKSFGNLREVDYDFMKLWHSHKAQEMRDFIKSRKCFCPLANQSYNNMLCDFPSMFKVFANFLRFK